MTDTLAAPDAPFHLTAPIEHITKLDDGTVLAHVVVTSESPDSQGEVVDYDAFKEAAPDLMKWAVLNEMHDPARDDAGTILKLYFDDEARRVEADIHVVDPVAVRKVVARVYKMVSIGGVKLATATVSAGGRSYRKITRLIVQHLALVPRGSNPDAVINKQFVLAKRAEEIPMPDDDRSPEQVAIDTTRDELAKAEAADPDVGGGRVRSSIPKDDFVFPEDAPDGGFPVTTAGDVSDAVSSWGRYRGPHTFAEFKARLTSIATRLGFASALPSAWKKEQKKMAKKAAQAAQAAAETIVKADAPPEPAEGDAPKPAFPGAKPPFTGKKAARKASKVAKAEKVAAFAKGNKTIKDLAEAYEAVMCAIQEEADEGDQDGVKALQAIADSIHECMSAEAAEPDGGDDQGGAQEEFDPELALTYAKGQRRLAKQAAGLRRRLAKSRRSNGQLRKAATKLRKERRELRKAAVLTSVLTKAGSRNSRSDLAKIDAIHEATVDLGTTAHRAAPVADAVADTPLAKAENWVTIMHEALKDLIPAKQLDVIEARVTAIDEKSAAQGEQLAKIAKRPTGGGPASSYAPVFRGGEVIDKASALAKAAEVIDDPRLKTQVGGAAALEKIMALRSSVG